MSHGSFKTALRPQLAVTLGLTAMIFAHPSRAQGAAATEQVLYSFTGGSDGSNPWASLVFDGSGNLYGTTQNGGLYGFGTVFELIPSQGGWTEVPIYSFTGGLDGSQPVGGLILDSTGNLYGTTPYGGTYGVGTAFELSPSGGGWKLSTLHSFGAGSDGVLPEGSVAFDASGNLYGTLDSGGTQNAGAVFELVHKGGTWIERIIHNFAGSSGSRPWAGVTLDAAGNVYGTTLYNGPGETGLGVVFELSPVFGGGWKYSIIHNFNSGGGGGPFGGVVFDSLGNLYGTTYGEASCESTVYKLAPNGGGKWTLSLLHEFNGTDGCQIYGGVTLDNAGNVYGVTNSGGTFDAGTVFELLLNAQGHWVRNTLYNFEGGTDGASSFAGVVLDSRGNIYGTTYSGGSSEAGTAFEVTP